MMRDPALLLFTLSIVTSVYATRDQALILGGKGVKKVNVFDFSGELKGNCSLIPDVPFEPLYSIGLRDYLGRAMVCGGSKNRNPKSCWILDRPSNTWVQGPNLKRERVGAAVACLDNGICWIFGGRSRSTTEWYNPETHSFETGPEMEVNSVHGLCAVYGPIQNLIYIAARRQPGKLRRFTFNPDSLEFEEFDELDGHDVRYPACGYAEYDEDDLFTMVGGGLGLNGGTDLGFYQYPDFDDGGTDDYPYKFIGGVAIPVESAKTFLVAGGVTPDGDYPKEVYAYYVDEDEWRPQYSLFLDPPRAFPIAVTVEAEDCPFECT